MSPSQRRRISWAVMGVVVAVALVVGITGQTGPRTNQDRVYAIADTMKCPQCVGQSVADSDVAIAREIRTEIARGVDDGLSDDEIRDQIAGSYGEEYLLTPSSEGVSALVWILPVVVAIAGLGAVAFYLHRRRSQASVHASDDDRVLVEAARADIGRGGDGSS